MKAFYAVFLLVFLTSCGSDTVTQVIEQTEPQAQAVVETVDEIDTALASLDDEDTDLESLMQKEVISEEIVEIEIASSEPSLIELSTTYTSPKTEVIMNIAMTVDENDIIETISVTSPNYSQMTKFDGKVQEVIGQNINEISDFHAAGSSLGTVAFQKALKNL